MRDDAIARRANDRIAGITLRLVQSGLRLQHQRMFSRCALDGAAEIGERRGLRLRGDSRLTRREIGLVRGFVRVAA